MKLSEFAKRQQKTTIKEVKADRTDDPFFKNTQTFGRIPTPTIKNIVPKVVVPAPVIPSPAEISRDKGNPTLKQFVQQENAKKASIENKTEKKVKSDSEARANMLERQLSDKYGIDVKRANSPIEAVNMLSMVDDSQKEQFKKDFAEYSFAAERSNPFRAGAEAGFNVLPTNLEKTEGKEDVQTAKGYGAGKLVGGIGQQLAFNSVLGPGIESLTSKLLPKATLFVAETIKDVAIGTGTQLAETPFDKPTVTQFAGNVALDIALNALFGVVGKGLSKVDLSNLKNAKPSQVVGDVAQKLNVSIVEADKVVDDAIDFYVNQSGIADTKQFDQLRLEAPKTKDLSDVSNTLSSKLRAKQSDLYVNQFGVADTKPFEQLQLEAPVRTNSDANGMRLSEKVKVSNVVDEIQSKTLLHGTNADFKEFDLNKTGSFTGNDGLYGTGVYLTENPTYAKVYGENVIQTKPNVKKPFVIDREVDLNEISRITGQPIPTSGIYSDKASEMISVNPKQFSEELQKLGYDSVVVKGGPNQTIEEMVVFDTKNISTDKPQLDRPSEFSIGAKYPPLAKDFAREVPKPARPRIEPTLKPIDRPSDFSVKKPIYPTLDPKFAKERPSVLTASDMKRIEPTLNVASKVDQPTTTMKIEPTLKQRADNVASKFENQPLETGDDVLNSGEIKERGFSENIRTDANRVDEVRKELDDNPEFYEVLGNKDTLASAQARFDRGYDEALQDFERTKSTLRADNVPFAKLLADEAAKRGDMNTARRIIVDVAENLTTAGQYSQAAKILRESNDPITVLRFVQKELDKLNKTGSTRYGKKWDKIDLTDSELDTINKLGKDATDEEKEQLFESLFESVSTRIPTTNREKFDAWRRIAMLFNPKTHVRNTLGNALMTGVKKVSNKVAQGLELSLPKDIRTKGNVTKELKAVSNDYFNKNKKQLMEGSRWEIFGVKSPFADKPIFKTGWLNTLDDVSKRTLEAEDIMFFKKNFTDDLASFMNTRGLKEPTQEAIDYATRRAQEATFRQANKLAEAINKMKGSRYGLLVDAAIPFTKTPANILATGIDYSPIGAIKGAITLINNSDPAKAIETLSKGLTGTSLSLLGYYMGMNGLARGEYEKSAKVEGLYQATGQLPNSIKTGKGSYTIDWAQPLSMPFFMGVAFAESLKKQSDDKAQAVFDALVAGGETLVKQSMLQGISDLFGGYGSTTEKIVQLPINYMTQGFPTVFGQIARVIDPSKRQVDYTTVASKTITPLISRTPIASTTLPEKFGILGEPQKYGKGLLNAFQQFLSPGFIGQPSENPLAQEIDRLYKEVGSDFLPKYNVSSFQSLGEQYKLSGTERSELQRIMGEYTAEQLSKMVETYVYRSATDEQKAEMIKKANETGYKLAKESIAKARGGK